MPLSSETFKALGDPIRLALFEILLEGPQRVTELVRRLAAPQPNVSRQLRILKDCGLVIDRKEGRWVEYRVARGQGSPADLLGEWAARFGRAARPPDASQDARPTNPDARPGRGKAEATTFVVRKPNEAFDSYLL